MAAQIHNGLAAQAVLYHFDFNDPDSDAPQQLNVRGEEELLRIVQTGTQPTTLTPLVPIVIQPTRDPGLDETRRQYVLQRLASAGLPAADEMVVVRRPDARGISGDEAVVLYQKLIQQFQSQGPAGGGGGGAGMGAGSAGILPVYGAGGGTGTGR
jgi:hypothetical protein